MKKMKRILILSGAAVVLCLSAGNLAAQQQRQGRGGNGNFDPAQFQQRMMERIREQMDVKNDDEWKVIQPRVEKVMEARRLVGFGGGGFGRGGRPPGGDNNAPGGNDQGGRRGFRGEPSPEAEALQKAIESKASAADTKAALTKFRAARKEKQANLEKAQAELLKVLSVQQEAVAVLAGLLS